MCALAIFIVTCGAAGCGGGSGSTSVAGPSAVTIPTTSSRATVVVAFVTTNGTYTATLNNQTYSANGGFTVDLAPGTYQVTGSFRASYFGANFGTVGAGGVQTGSVRSVSGPLPDARACSIIYDNSNTPSTQRSFQFQFVVTSSVGSACQGI
jgi:hypothetical protein